MYSVEQQALVQLVSAPEVVNQPTLAQFFRTHHAETKEQVALVEERLKALGGSPSAIKDAVMKLGGRGFLLFARVQPETPGRLVAHAYSYEAMEWAGYQMLIRLAQSAGDSRTAEIARTIAAQERAMMERLESGFDAAEQASHANTPPHEMGEHLRKHLAEAHALEVQSMQLLKKSEKIADQSNCDHQSVCDRGHELEQIYHRHLDETRVHALMIEQRLNGLGSGTSKLKDTALALGAINWGLFFQARRERVRPFA
jgi:ferritin-like metal-binding protein YciE